MRLLLRARYVTFSFVVTAVLTAKPYIGNTPQCLSAISQGHWIETRCDMDPPPKGKATLHVPCAISVCVLCRLWGDVWRGLS
jgi:hypothetical protein